MHVTYTRTPETYVDRDVIAAETDAAKLIAWRTELEELAEDITESIKANAFAGVVAGKAVSKLSFTKMAIGWITRRLRKLDIEPEDQTYAERLKAEIVQLHAQNDRLRQSLAAAREAREVQKLAIVVHAAGGLVRISPTHATEAFDLVLRLTEDKATGDVIYTTEVYCA